MPDELMTFSYIKIINSYRSVHIVKTKDKGQRCDSLMEPLTNTGKALECVPSPAKHTRKANSSILHETFIDQKTP